MPPPEDSALYDELHSEFAVIVRARFEKSRLKHQKSLHPREDLDVSILTLNISFEIVCRSLDGSLM